MNKNEKQDINTTAPWQYFYPPLPYPNDDEINLTDVLRTLKKHKKEIIATFLIITFVGSAYAFLKADIFNYSTAIQMGSIFLDGKETAVDDVKNSENKVKEIYVPLALSDFYKQNPDKPKNIKIDVIVPKDSHFLVLSSKSSDKESEVFKDLMTKISTNLIDNQNQMIKSHVNILTVEIANAKNRLKILVENEKEVFKKIEEFDKSFKSSSNDNIGTTALVIMELMSQKKQEIENQKYELESLISEKQSALSSIKESKLLKPITQSIEPVGVDRKLIIILSVFLGAISAVLLALVSDFIEKMRNQITAPS
jgi:LPS O-antigen subunit length determinant protein (WzzB/FepE family)